MKSNASNVPSWALASSIRSSSRARLDVMTLTFGMLSFSLAIQVYLSLLSSGNTWITEPALPKIVCAILRSLAKQNVMLAVSVSVLASKRC